MKTLRMTAAEALVRFLTAQRVRIAGEEMRLVEGVWAIFGHGNVAGLGHALQDAQDDLPTFRGHNEQSMAHAATAFAKAWRRRRLMAVTTSIGPGATNLVTAAAAAHVNRMPLLLLPGDVFASRAPDPVLQQVEDFGEPAVTANDCLRPVSRWFDRITRPEQLQQSLPQAIRTLTDPATCGPVTLALPQDVQTEAADFPEAMFARRVHGLRRARPDRAELARAAAALRGCRRPLIVAGGGVLYSEAEASLFALAKKLGAPVASTQAGHGVLPWSEPLYLGGLGVTGSAAANALAKEADLVLCVGTRLSDFTTASRTLFAPQATLLSLNVAAFDAVKHRSVPLVADAREGLEELRAAVVGAAVDPAFTARAFERKAGWDAIIASVTTPQEGLPTDAQVVGAVNEAAGRDGVVVCAAGGLPGELHKLYRPSGPGRYHLEYGYSTMGYEIAGGLGVKMAQPTRDVFVMVGDGSYLMMNSELATSVSEGHKLIVVLLDNRGFGCIHRLQASTGRPEFKNLHRGGVDFVAHARALGAEAEKVEGVDALKAALGRAKQSDRSYVVVIETDPDRGTAEGGAWWEVAVPEVSTRPEVQAAYEAYLAAKAGQAKG